MIAFAREDESVENILQKLELIRTEGYGFADEFIRNLNDIFSGLVIVPDSSNLIRIEEIARTYALLPNDALIVATCREQGISKIATFDRDFSKIKDPVRVKI